MTSSFLTPACGYHTIDPFTCLRIEGADRVSFISNLCTNEIKALRPGSGCESFFTNVQGKILGHLGVLVDEAELRLITPGAFGDVLWRHLEKYHIREEVEIVDQSEITSATVFLGEAVGKVMSRLVAEPLTEPWSHCCSSDGELPACQVVRFPVVGAPAYLVLVEKQHQETLLNGLLELAEAVQPVELSAEQFDTLRVESGFPVYGRDIDDSNLPQELDRDALAINFQKGCYLGQETVARIDALGQVNWLFRAIECSEPLQAGMQFTQDGRAVARITTVSESGRVGLGYVRHALANAADWQTTDNGSIRIVPTAR